MGVLSSQYSTSLITELLDNIQSNTSQYYAFAANPIPFTSNTISPVDDTSYQVNFDNNWLPLFGKRFQIEDLALVFNKYLWEANTVYQRWDNTKNLSQTKFYTITTPEVIGGDYQLYVCIDNANGAPSTYAPRLTLPTTFQTFPDGYKWRYVSSINSGLWDQFFTEFFAPLTSNATIQASAPIYSGVEVIPITNNGINYSAYTNGYVQEVLNSTAVALELTANNEQDVYTHSSIYFYSVANNAYKICNIDRYIVEANNYKYVILDREIEINKIIPRLTQYTIQPQVNITSDANANLKPEAICSVNAVTNSISYIEVLNPGSNVSWANVQIIANNSYGTGATAYAIVPPPGGHGFNPKGQIPVEAVEWAWFFQDTESNTISTNCSYNKIGIVRNPPKLVANSSGVFKGPISKANTFNQLFEATLNPGYTFSNNQQIIGATSNSLGVIVYQANDSYIQWVGDYTFIDGEPILDPLANNIVASNVNISKWPDLYLKDSYPLYAQNINNITRSNTQTESYRLVVSLSKDQLYNTTRG